MTPASQLHGRRALPTTSHPLSLQPTCSPSEQRGDATARQLGQLLRPCTCPATATMPRRRLIPFACRFEALSALMNVNNWNSSAYYELLGNCSSAQSLAEVAAARQVRWAAAAAQLPVGLAWADWLAGWLAGHGRHLGPLSLSACFLPRRMHIMQTVQPACFPMDRRVPLSTHYPLQPATPRMAMQAQACDDLNAPQGGLMLPGSTEAMDGATYIACIEVGGRPLHAAPCCHACSNGCRGCSWAPSMWVLTTACAWPPAGWLLPREGQQERHSGCGRHRAPDPGHMCRVSGHCVQGCMWVETHLPQPWWLQASIPISVMQGA